MRLDRGQMEVEDEVLEVRDKDLGERRGEESQEEARGFAARVRKI